jgi:anhydro-N-acetylmuramic acid kinase
MPTRLIIGLMSGTSVDAIDAALVRITRAGQRYRAQVLAHREHAWPKALRARLLAIMAPAQTTTQELCELNFAVAHQFAAATTRLLKAEKLPPAQITALASHGQTICHLPPQSRTKIQHSPIPSTLQLGDVSVLATLTGITTIGNFRPADMAVGGQGAPLVPWTDAMLLSHPTKTRCVQNIGGIGNVTYLPRVPRGVHPLACFDAAVGSAPRNTLKRELRAPVIAFDTGPGNMLIDAAVQLATRGRQKFDRHGRLARTGTLDEKLFRRLQKHPYFAQCPPKSTGRETFGIPLLRSLLTTDRPLTTLAHTLTRLTAWSIADAYHRFLPHLPDEVILCGGGADNPVLVHMLREELGPGPALTRIDDFGIPNKAKEAASFALLAAATLDGIPSNLPTVTGASRPVVLGAIARPHASRRS